MDKVLEINAQILYFINGEKTKQLLSGRCVLTVSSYRLLSCPLFFFKPPPRVLRFRTVSCVLPLRLSGMLAEIMKGKKVRTATGCSAHLNGDAVWQLVTPPV